MMRVSLWECVFIVANIGLAVAPARAQERARRYPGTPTEELRKLAEKGEADAIFQLGERRDRISRPIFEKYAVPIDLPEKRGKESLATLRKSSDSRQRSALSLEARRALARIGVHPDISDFIKCASNHRSPCRSLCIERLGYISDSTAVKTLGPILSETGTPPHGRNDLTPSYAESSAQSLGKILPDVQARYMLGRPDSSSHLDQWRSWWEKHSDFDPDKYDQPISSQPLGGFRKIFR